MSDEKPTSDDPTDDRPSSDDASSGDEAFATTSEVPFRVPKPFVEGRNAPILIALALSALVAASFHFALAPAAPKLAAFVALGLVYTLFAALTVVRFKKKHDLALLRPKSGDITIAAAVAGLLYGLAYVGASVILPHGSARESWLVHVYVLLSDAFRDGRHILSVGLFLIGGLEELSWRGIVLDAFESRFGRLQASVLSSAFWAVAHVPTLYRLGDPVAGPNPLLLVAAFGCGMTWCYVRYRTDRLAPSVISHAIFSWAIVEFPLWHQ